MQRQDGGKGMDVFISYKSEDSEKALWIKSMLEQAGISCWMAPMCIPIGSDYGVEIPPAIREAKAFILVISEVMQTSQWIPKELNEAINAQRVLIPLLLEPCPLRDDYAFKLSNVQFYKLYEDEEATMREVIMRLLGVLAMDNMTPAADPQTQPESPAEIITEEPEEAKQQTPAETVPEPPQQTPQQTPEQAGDQPAEPPKPTRKRRAAKKKDKDKPRPKRGFLRVLCIVGACLIALCVATAIITAVKKAANSFEIAGQKFTTKSTSIYFTDTELSSQDVKNMQRLKKIDSLTLIRCTFPSYDLGQVLPSVQISVTLEACGLTDTSTLDLNLGELQAPYLVLDGNPGFVFLSVLEPLHDQLRELSFRDCGVSDITSLQSFTKLGKLDCANNGITDISPLAQCGALLTKLDLSGNQITNISALAQCGAKLTKLDLSGNRISSLEPLQSCKDLSELYVNNCQLESLEGLETCIRLKTLQASGNKIADLTPLQNATILTTVDLGSNQIEDFSTLKKSGETIENLILNNNRIADADPAGSFTALKSLNLSSNQIKSLPDLSKCSALTVLSLSDNQLESGSFIFWSSHLTYLDLSENSITSVQFLPLAESDVTLDIHSNPIRSMTLPSDVEYDKLIAYDIDFTGIFLLGELYRARGATLVISYAEQMSFDQFTKDAFSTYYLLDCPLDLQLSAEETFGYGLHLMTTQEYLQQQ